MNIAVTTGTKPIVPPANLESWRQCEADLRQRQQANDVERGQIMVQRQESALAAARGDAGAQKRIAGLAAREAELQLAGANLVQGLAVAAQEIGAWEMHAAREARAAGLRQFREKLAARLELVAEIERCLGDVMPLLNRLSRMTSEIEQTHTSLGGQRPILPPLAQEAVGGRLAEFMAGSGFAAWLPLARPEIRPALASWLAAEQSVQDSYRLTD